MAVRRWPPFAVVAVLLFSAVPCAAQGVPAQTPGRITPDPKRPITALPVAMPDLAATACVFRPASSPRGNTNIGYGFTYKNIGTANAVFLTQAWEWSATAPDGRGFGGGVNTGPGYNMVPGEERRPGYNATPSLATFAEGTYTFVFRVDPENKVAESNEANNQISCTLTITPGTTMAPTGDLVISSLTLDTPSPSANSAFNLRVTIKNQGTSNVDVPSGTRILAGDPYVTSAIEYAMFALPAGGTRSYVLGPTSAGIQRGTRTWTIVLDPENRVTETTKANNQGTISVTVK